MELGLSGRVALIGASSRGLGFAVARELAREGASVVLVARNPAALEAARATLAAEASAEVLAVPADLSREGEGERVGAAALARFGRVDILVTNSGGPPSGPFEQHDGAAWQAAYELLVRGPIEMARTVLPGMRARRWGRIIAITSIAVKQPVDGLILSNSLRGALTGFARTLANEVAQDGVTVNCVLPGYTRTERVVELARATAGRSGIPEADVYARWEREIPLGRIGEVEEFAAMVAFLSSARASYITGQSVAVDGGWIKGLL